MSGVDVGVGCVIGGQERVREREREGENERAHVSESEWVGLRMQTNHLPPRLFTALNNLKITHEDNKKPTEAVKVYERLLKVVRKLPMGPAQLRETQRAIQVGLF